MDRCAQFVHCGAGFVHQIRALWCWICVPTSRTTMLRCWICARSSFTTMLGIQCTREVSLVQYDIEYVYEVVRELRYCFFFFFLYELRTLRLWIQYVQGIRALLIRALSCRVFGMIWFGNVISMHYDTKIEISVSCNGVMIFFVQFILVLIIFNFHTSWHDHASCAHVPHVKP